ncbi:MAG: FGGY family carbohydrate kinase [Bacillota bacterium]|nr:FGGY family carbohydrate kinase [Bacillota bacterium]
MAFITIDLGTTNIKVTAFSDALNEIGHESEKVTYQCRGNQVEFDPDLYFEILVQSIYRIVPLVNEKVRQVILTGQAESLVVLDDKGKPLRAAISWLDTRSSRECEEIKKAFPESLAYQITGQPANTPTWPITKMLWLKKHEAQLFERAAKYVLLKDYIQYRLSGQLLGEYSIYNFSYYFDITKKVYWHELLDWSGIRRQQLPDLVEPCTTVGSLLPSIADTLGLDRTTCVNIGTLDHFAGMIGTGNIERGIISESTGTVLSLATLTDRPILSSERMPCHYGPFAGSYVMMPVCESGGISLEWFWSKIVGKRNFQQIDAQSARLQRPSEILFLPYLTGTNSPDYNQDARGVFYGLKLNHDRIDCALAVMEGVAWLLYRNLKCLDNIGIRADRVITTGGGSKSAIWCQIKADMTGCSFMVPAQTEAASLGSALIGAVASGVIKNYHQGLKQTLFMKKTWQPTATEQYRRQVHRYETLYEQLQPVFKQDARLQQV